MRIRMRGELKKEGGNEGLGGGRRREEQGISRRRRMEGDGRGRHTYNSYPLVLSAYP